ncbi:MAG: hypothetical protein ACI9O1_000692 [Candidatus Thalassarchaeaceae archaeon]|jgi:hypothetical protein
MNFIFSEIIKFLNNKLVNKFKIKLGAKISLIIMIAVILISSTSSLISLFVDENINSKIDDFSSEKIEIIWEDSQFMPRHEECIDDSNGQDLPEYGIGYEPSISITSNGNMFITAHKDLRWGGESNPFFPVLGGEPGPWYACQSGQQTSWDYWASWLWASFDNGTTWGHGDGFEPTPGNSFTANYIAGGSECLGDEGDISVDSKDNVYYLDTTLEDNWWHILSSNGTEYETVTCQRMNTMAADDRPWVAAQGEGIIHYLGNSGVSPLECTGDVGRYWYYHSEDAGLTFSQCYAVPGGWSTIASQKHGPYVYIAQEDADTASGSVIIRISDDYGRGTGLTDGSWADPKDVGERKGNCPEGYPVVNTNEIGTVAVVWSDCPNGATGAWEMKLALSYDYGLNWTTWDITHMNGIHMYPFVSISDDNTLAIAFYGIDFDDNQLEGDYVEGEKWYAYAAAIKEPKEGDLWNFKIIDPEPLHIVTAYEEIEGDTHALHDFFETVISEDGTWMGIAYQVNIGIHPFEENEEQRYIKFVKGKLLI